MGGGGQSVDHPAGTRCLIRIQMVKARLKTKSEAMQAYAEWLYDRLAQSTKVGFLLHAANVRKTVLIAEWEAAHKRLLAFKESTEEIQFTFRKLQKNLEVVEQKVKEMDVLQGKPLCDISDADGLVALLADLRETCSRPAPGASDLPSAEFETAADVSQPESSNEESPVEDVQEMSDVGVEAANEEVGRRSEEI